MFLPKATATLSDGRVFVIGGSWSGGTGGTGRTPYKDGEVCAPKCLFELT